MKILFDHPSPFALAHGGLQIQTEQTKRALQGIGLEVEPLGWWDASQSGDVIHYFGRPSPSYVQHAHEKGIKVVMCDLLTGMASRTPFELGLQKAAIRIARKLVPREYLNRLAWDSYKLVDAVIANTKWDAELTQTMFDASPDRVHVVPNGVEDIFFVNSANAEE